ncbi:MAG: ABC transporter permease [Alphaproteobacteria bacterium]|nr:ABC transporter permease [Alphaproteobacteria bacterium]
MLGFKLSPLFKRRIEQFKSNKRAKRSLIVFGCIFFLSLFADFICNEKPLLVYYKGEIYLPLIKKYPETEFGGFLETETNYRDPVVIELITKDGWIIPSLISFSPWTINYDLPQPAPAPPSTENLFGTDDQGRDVFTRLLYGFRTSILFGLLLTLGSVTIGIFAGAIQGYFGGKVDLICQRLLEIWSGLPILYLLIILSSMVEPNFWWLLGIMMLFSWVSIVGVVRAEFLRTRSLDYVRAAEAMGVPTYQILYKHMLPNAMVATVTYIPFILNGSIATLTSLDFLGFGLPPGSASLGELITQAKNNLHAPWLAISIFISISLLLSLLIFIGEGIRDAFDPRKGAKVYS